MRLMACCAQSVFYRRMLGLGPLLPFDAIGMTGAADLKHGRFQEFGLS